MQKPINGRMNPIFNRSKIKGGGVSPIIIRMALILIVAPVRKTIGTIKHERFERRNMSKLKTFSAAEECMWTMFIDGVGGLGGHFRIWERIAQVGFLHSANAPVEMTRRMRNRSANIFIFGV